MCGLAGIARLGGEPLPVAGESLLQAMTKAVAHRGPDEQVFQVEGPVGLGFTRLALVAPDAGDQPFHTPDGTIVSIVNGEVYNHRQLAAGLASGAVMRTGSDCEVLAHLYQERGRNFLDDVNGMFALVLYDATRRRLVFARDRFGIKPLYFHRNTGRIVFSSEIKALFLDRQTPRAVDWGKALAQPMLQSAPMIGDVEPVTWFSGIEYVEPGTITEIDLDDGYTVSHRYWDLFGHQPDMAGSDEDLIAEYGRLFAESVADCAQADAELGILLSGGVDSAAVAALAARTTDLHTFTILSRTTVESGDAYYSDLVARHLGLPNHQVRLPYDHCPTVDEWLRFLWLMEHPMAGAEAYLKYQLHRYVRAERPHLKGMLLGAASDEFNGGYSFDLAGGGDWTTFVHHLGLLSRRGDERLAPHLAEWTEAVGHPILRRESTSAEADDYLRFLRYQYRKVYQYNVWHEDRSAAGSGIEARVPFLDHRLVEFVTAVPAVRRERLLWDKRILREAVRDLLPEEVAQREKVPFVYGQGAHHMYGVIARMLGRDGGALIDLALSGGAASEHLDGPALRAAVEDLGRGPGDARAEFLLRLVNLGLLDYMLAELPPALVEAPALPVLRAVPDIHFSDHGQLTLKDAILGRTPVDLQAVPRWRDRVLVLSAADGTRQKFIAVDGSIEYVVDGDASLWFALVSEIDGSRNLGKLLDSLSGRYEDIREELHVALDVGLLDLIDDAHGPALSADLTDVSPDAVTRSLAQLADAR